MDFEWVAIALGDVAWISLAFVLGYLAKLFGLPPLVGSWRPVLRSIILASPAAKCYKNWQILASRCYCLPLA